MTSSLSYSRVCYSHERLLFMGDNSGVKWPQCARPRPDVSYGVVDFLLAVLYVVIVCDLIYLFCARYITTSRLTTAKSVDRQHLVKKASSSKIQSKKKFLTLDSLWKRLRTEARHFQMISSRHRTITENMMESRLQARSLEKERAITRARTRVANESDLSVEMVRWADRISAEHDTRCK